MTNTFEVTIEGNRLVVIFNGNIKIIRDWDAKDDEPTLHVETLPISVDTYKDSAALTSHYNDLILVADVTHHYMRSHTAWERWVRIGENNGDDTFGSGSYEPCKGFGSAWFEEGKEAGSQGLLPGLSMDVARFAYIVGRARASSKLT